MSFAKVSYVAHVPGHKNSQGEAAPWVVKSHEDDHIISSHKTRAEAKQHLQDMHAHSGSLKTAATTSVNALDHFTRAYVEAALWSSTDDDDTPLDNKYGVEDIAPDTLKAMIEDCKQFQQQNSSLFTDCRRSNEYTDDEMAGHDFWLTRNRHGAGFWDGDWPTTGDQLDRAAKRFGEANLYVGDDGYIYQYGKETPGPVPPREDYNPTQEELADLKAMGIQGSKKALWKPDPKYVMLDVLENVQARLSTLLTGKNEERIRGELYSIARVLTSRFKNEDVEAKFGGEIASHYIKAQQILVDLENSAFSLSPKIKQKIKNVLSHIETIISLVAKIPDRHISSLKKEAVYIEEQWEDILQKKGYVVDESKESDWNDTMYFNPAMPDISVMLHEGGGDTSYFVVELNGKLLEEGENPDTLWQTLDKAVQLYRQSIKHEREFNDEDKTELKSMGVLGSINPLFKKATPFAKYDYEANGNDVVLISPTHQTRLLEGDEARNFWVALDTLEGTPETEYDAQLQQTIQEFMGTKMIASSVNYMVQVEASHLLKNAASSKPVFISSVEYNNGKIEKFKFTSNTKKAMVMSRVAAVGIKQQLPDFRLDGVLKLAESSHLEDVKEANYGQEVIIDIHEVPPEFFNKKDVRQFTEKLCDEIGMKRGPNYVWGDDNELGTMHNPKADGLSCVQFLYSSSITIHAIDELQKVFINVFSCKTFDSEKVKRFAEEKIGGRIVSFHDFKRI